MIGTCKQGRPRYEIHREELKGLRDLAFIWKNIAEILCVSQRTLRTKRQELEITGKYTGKKTMSWITLFKRYYTRRNSKHGRKNASKSSEITNSAEMFALLHWIELTRLEKSHDVYKRYVEESITMKDQMLYG